MEPIDPKVDPSLPDTGMKAEDFLTSSEFLRRLANSLVRKDDVVVLVPDVSIRLRVIADTIEFAEHIVKEKHGTDRSKSRPKSPA